MKHITPTEAYELQRTNPDALLIDVRSEIEYLFVGHPVGAIHVSWNDGPDWEVNPNFIGEVKKLAG
ncbi:MAG TPA: rhodanese-like domain-containing protein, partial [Thauera sp.]|nr:rhodanese-like domain-containing protein [Thauera sp.]